MAPWLPSQEKQVQNHKHTTICLLCPSLCSKEIVKWMVIDLDPQDETGGLTACYTSPSVSRRDLFP